MEAQCREFFKLEEEDSTLPSLLSSEPHNLPPALPCPCMKVKRGLEMKPLGVIGGGDKNNFRVWERSTSHPLLSVPLPGAVAQLEERGHRLTQREREKRGRERDWIRINKGEKIVNRGSQLTGKGRAVREKKLAAAWLRDAMEQEGRGGGDRKSSLLLWIETSKSKKSLSFIKQTGGSSNSSKEGKTAKRDVGAVCGKRRRMVQVVVVTREVDQIRNKIYSRAWSSRAGKARWLKSHKKQSGSRRGMEKGKRAIGSEPSQYPKKGETERGSG
jgi:hypothetical protein